jgi:hypothetical protein
MSVSNISSGPKFIEKIFSFPAKIIGFIFSNGNIARVSIFSILMIIMLVGAASDSVKQHSAQPILDELGGKLVGADIRIEELTNKIFFNTNSISTWQNIKNIFLLTEEIYYIYFIYWLLTLFWQLIVGRDQTFANFCISTICIIAIQITWAAIELREFRVPFKGVIFLIATLFSTVIPSWRDKIIDIYSKLGTSVGG